MKINGRRGAFQLSFALVFALMGTSYVFLPSSRGRSSALEWVANLIPLDMVGWLWLGAALIASVSAFLPRPRDGYSFAALALVPTVWGFLYLIGALKAEHYPYLLTTVLYWAMAAAVMVASGMEGANDRDERRAPA